MRMDASIMKMTLNVKLKGNHPGGRSRWEEQVRKGVTQKEAINQGG
jgi:hypothetical protein